MPARRRTKIRAEGWYYLVVLGFILGGAVMRQLNPLLLLAGLMTGPLVFNWRLTAVTMRKLSFNRLLPKRATAGESFVVDIELTNHRTRLSGWAITVDDRIEQLGGQQPPVAAAVLLPTAPPGKTVRASYRCNLPQRGAYTFGPLRGSTRFPLGLVETAVTGKKVQGLLVAPRTGQLTREWRRLIDDDRSGGPLARRRQGVIEGDFFGLREWRAGDSQRWIHWRTSARLGELAVRQFERQTSRELNVVLDLCLPGQPANQSLEKKLEHIETAVSFAATVASDLSRQGGGGRVTFGISGSTADTFTGAISPLFLRELLDALTLAQSSHQDHLPGLLAEIYATTPPGVRTVVISTRNRNQVDTARERPNGIRAEHGQAMTTWLNVAEGISRYFELDKLKPEEPAVG